MDPLSVAVLDPASDSYDYVTVFDAVCERYVEHDVSIAGYAPHEETDDGYHLPDGTDYDAVLVTGSRFSVYDEEHEDWVSETGEYLRDVLDEGVPVLGVCFGHQLLARACGGTVDKLPERVGEQEIGFHDVDLNNAGRTDPLYTAVKELPDCFVSFAYHGDTVADLPRDATPLAANQYGLQSYRLDDRPGWGIQFHPEYTPGMAAELIGELDAASIDPVMRAMVADSIDAARDDPDYRAAKDVITNFFDGIVASSIDA